MPESKPQRNPEPSHPLSATIYLQAKKQGLHGGLGAMPPEYARDFRRSQRKATSSVAPEPESNGVLEIESGPDHDPQPRRYSDAFPRRYGGAFMRSQLKAEPPVPPKLQVSPAPAPGPAPEPNLHHSEMPKPVDEAEQIDAVPSQSKRFRFGEWMRSREVILWARIGGLSAVAGVVIAFLAWLFPQGQ